MEVSILELAQKCPDITLSIKASDLIDFRRSLVLEVLDGIARERAASVPAVTEELLTREETMQLLGISGATIWRWKKSGYLVPVQIGSMDRYRRSDLDKIINQKGGAL